MILAEFWPLYFRKLHDPLPAQQFQAWIAPLTVGEENGTWVVYGKNQSTHNMLQNRFAVDIEAVHAELAPQQATLLFKTSAGRSYPIASDASGKSLEERPSESILVHPRTTSALSNKTAADILVERIKNLPHGNRRTEPEPVPAATNPTTKTKPDEQRGVARTHCGRTNLSSDYTFETLVEGRGNRIATAAARSIAKSPGQSYNPFFPYGGTGLGETHLIQAIDNKLLKNRSGARVRYMHSDDYIHSFMSAVRTNSYNVFKQQYKQHDLLIIDDIRFVRGRDRTMEEFFYLYSYFHNKKKQLILTCDILPARIEDMDDRLKSRFLQGLTLELEPPELEVRVVILQKKTESSGINLTDEAAFFVANLIHSNARGLEDTLSRVDASSCFMNKPIDIDLVCDALQGIIAVRHRVVTVDIIIDVTAKYYRIKVSDMLGKKHTRNIARPRQVVMSLIRELTNLSLPSIDSAFGGRDYTTIIHGAKAIAKLCEDDPELAQDYEKLLTMIQN